LRTRYSTFPYASVEGITYETFLSWRHNSRGFPFSRRTAINKFGPRTFSAKSSTRLHETMPSRLPALRRSCLHIVNGDHRSAGGHDTRCCFGLYTEEAFSVGHFRCDASWAFRARIVTEKSASPASRERRRAAATSPLTTQPRQRPQVSSLLRESPPSA
jgi:hypothetical protein